MTGALPRRIVDANESILGRGDLDAVSEFFAPGFIAHFTGRDMKGGPRAVRKFASQILDAFPGVKVSVQILAQDGDRVAWQRTLRGTQRGAYEGFPASGRRVTWRDMVVSRFEGGLIVEDWAISDLAEQLLRSRKRR